MLARDVRLAVAPALAPVETVDVLRRLEQARRIAAAEACAASDDFRQLALELYPFDPFADRIWSLRHSVSGDHAWYVALGEVLNLRLATLDERLSRAEGPVANSFCLRSDESTPAKPLTAPSRVARGALSRNPRVRFDAAVPHSVRVTLARWGGLSGSRPRLRTAASMAR